jgi:NACalpha-BTF3-like transcription factor
MLLSQKLPMNSLYGLTGPCSTTGADTRSPMSFVGWIVEDEKQNQSMMSFMHSELQRMEKKEARIQTNEVDSIDVDEHADEDYEPEDDCPDIDKKDLCLMLCQVDDITRGQAIKALRDAKGDLVNAIMSFTGL